MSDVAYLTFDIGGTKIASGLVRLPRDPDGAPEVTDVTSIPTLPERGGDDILERLLRLASDRLRACRESDIPIAGVGIGSAGVVDIESGVILSATDLIPGWAGQRIAEAFAGITDLPFRMVGDVGAHGLGESTYGAGRGHRRVLSVGVGTGIGGAIVDDGRLVVGAHGVAGHIGHMSHGLGDGVPCSCGATAGHIEPVASGTGLGTLYNRMRPEGVDPVPDGKAVSDLVAAGDAFAARVMAVSARALGECLAGACNLLDPDAVVVSGSVAGAGEVWWDALREGFAAGALPLVAPTPLLPGALGGAAPLIGAAVAVARAS
ncbi:ROK family protein [Bifidobacterium sp. MA2]|uniref:ROK family protein n=1 Tax=Bifidobacterium santillanense TaxID=2809028 RepID=A0ABS5UQL7_9BIFI|nr:ROK family protein [Bifidobacterium santillanense]MBT1173227.1 ROK family protein [Bifidobacterium santillanense]